MKIKHIILSLSSILFFGSIVFAQEEIRPLSANPALKNAVRFLPAYRAEADTFDLDKYPFWDDFSGDSPYPKDSLWLDNYVFINSSLAYRPISMNTATFDGLNELGIPYNPGVVNSKGKRADQLTSVCIDLSKYQKKDSLYLSFYYQAAGLGEIPDAYDSLVLEFKADSVWNGAVWEKNKWMWIWSVSGSGMKPFQQVILPVSPHLYDTNLSVDPIANFYHQGFQFRFVNYGSLEGNMDVWHLDYVYLNKGRSLDDVFVKDMTIYEKPITLLNDYTSMPYDHFDGNTSYFRNTLQVSARKLNNSPLNLIGRCSIIDKADGDVILMGGDDKTIYDSDTTLILAFNVRDSLQLGKVTSSDSVELQTILRSEVIDDWSINDEVRATQGFYNYYAYDDGIPEFGYGVYPGSYAMVAYKFSIPDNLPVGDSLRGVYFYFNQSKEINVNSAFKILVWNEGDYENSTPVSFEARVPGLDYINGNAYHLFDFDTGIGVSKEFYIGWEQNSEFFMNIGLDMNYYEVLGDTFPVRSNPNIAYYTNNKWKKSSAKGALMIRPIISDVLRNPASVEDRVEMNIQVYPNPANGFIRVKGISGIFSVKLIDLQGKVQKQFTAMSNQSLDVSNLATGLYLLQVIDEKSNLIFNDKILIK
jgi:hypothetical protein